jgi:ABC-type uncharacterized transport system permease subunit
MQEVLSSKRDQPEIPFAVNFPVGIFVVGSAGLLLSFVSVVLTRPLIVIVIAFPLLCCGVFVTILAENIFKDLHDPGDRLTSKKYF